MVKKHLPVTMLRWLEVNKAHEPFSWCSSAARLPRPHPAAISRRGPRPTNPAHG